MKTTEMIILETYDKVNNLQDDYKRTIKVLNDMIIDLQQTTLKQQKIIDQLVKIHNDSLDYTLS